jgi:sugar/nucleoside kinase (ribokinase family)
MNVVIQISGDEQNYRKGLTLAVASAFLGFTTIVVMDSICTTDDEFHELMKEAKEAGVIFDSNHTYDDAEVFVF